MKIYCNEIELSKPAPIQIWVSKNSDYGIGLYVTKNGVGTSFLLFDGETQLSTSSTLDKYTVYNITSANKAETKVLTVKSNNQEVKITVNTTASNCAEYTPPVPPPAEPGLDEQGVKNLLSSNNVEQINTTNLYTTNVFALQQVNGNMVTATDLTATNIKATDLICENGLTTNMSISCGNMIDCAGGVNAVYGFGIPSKQGGISFGFAEDSPQMLSYDDVVKLKALIANS